MADKKAYLISCSDHYSHRLHVVDAYLGSRGYDTTYITSDFDHTSKKVFDCDVPGCVQLPAIPYEKNLSLARILSHRNFSRDVFRYLESQPREPEVVVVQLPPNFLGHYAKKYKKRHPQVKLIFEIFDMWPETFPYGKVKKLLYPVFKVWAWLRDHSLSAADLVVTECDMFRQKLRLSEEQGACAYLCAEAMERMEPRLRSDGLDICYLGAINNIIGIQEICDILAGLARRTPVTLHIIGKGEKEQEFVDRAQASGAEVIFYGPIYDDEQKQQIMHRCHLGLNVMKDSVCVGLTMKSVDYFRHGLPIINSVPGDSCRLVEQREVGVQTGEDCVEKILSLTREDYLQMRENVACLFAEAFEKSVVLDRYASILDPVLGP
jgi:glycosyltransferase involved in cell wall biosynthesis